MDAVEMANVQLESSALQPLILDPVQLATVTVQASLDSESNIVARFFFIHWENHFHHLTSKLQEFLRQNILTDVTFLGENYCLSVHRTIFSFFSQYLKQVFKQESKKACYILVKDIKQSTMQAIVDYIYEGKMSLPTNDIETMYRTAEFLQGKLFHQSECQEIGDHSYFNWVHYQSEILHHLWLSRADASQCDVTFITSNYVLVYAHSCIVGACSEYFLNIFVQSEVKSGPFVFALQNVSSQDLEIVLEFCYKGNVSISKECMKSFYETASLMGVKELCQRLLSIDASLKENKAAISNANCVTKIKTIGNIEQTKLTNIFSNLLEVESLVDVFILKNTQCFKVHSAILCAFSPYFRNYCKIQCFRNAFFLIKDMDVQNVQAFLNYIYRGETEFVGTVEDFYHVMSEWIDFNLLPVSEETLQVYVKNNVSGDVQRSIHSAVESSIEPKGGEVVFQEDIHQVSFSSEEPSAQIKDLQHSERVDESQKHEETTFQTSGNTKVNDESRPHVEDSVENVRQTPAKHAADRDTKSVKSEIEDAGDDFVGDLDEDETSIGKKSDSDALCTCYTCGDKFETRRAFREHMLIHPNAKIMKCKYCGKGFRKPSQLKAHVRVHTGSRPYPCKECGKNFMVKSALRKHQDTHLRNKQFVCDICTKSFSRKEYLEEHLRTHTGSKPYKCDICGKDFVGKTGLNHHKQTHQKNNKNSVCEICGKSFTRHALWTHMKTHEKVYKCDTCFKRFTTSNLLQFHVEGTHLGQKKNQCEVCGKGFVQKNHLQRHMQVHSEERRFKCDKCLRSFSVESKLLSHIRMSHSDPGEKLFSCDICHKKFAGRSTVIYHRRQHTGEKPHTCSFCNKQFTRPDALRQHLRCHTGERPYECPVCRRKCTSKSTLNKHLRTHINDKRNEKDCQFSCEICGKGFPSSTHLHFHTRAHNREKPYSCDLCNRSFRYQDSLKKHATVHAVQASYSCQICGQTFNESNSLQEHMDIHSDKFLACNFCGKEYNNKDEYHVHITGHIESDACHKKTVNVMMPPDAVVAAVALSSDSARPSMTAPSHDGHAELTLHQLQPPPSSIFPGHPSNGHQHVEILQHITPGATMEVRIPNSIALSSGNNVLSSSADLAPLQPLQLEHQYIQVQVPRTLESTEVLLNVRTPGIDDTSSQTSQVQQQVHQTWNVTYLG